MGTLYDLLSLGLFALVAYVAIRFLVRRVRKVDQDLKQRQAMNEAVYLETVRRQFAAVPPKSSP